MGLIFWVDRVFSFFFFSFFGDEIIEAGCVASSGKKAGGVRRRSLGVVRSSAGEEGEGMVMDGVAVLGYFKRLYYFIFPSRAHHALKEIVLWVLGWKGGYAGLVRYTVLHA